MTPLLEEAFRRSFRAEPGAALANVDLPRATRVEGIAPASPAELLGVKEGDILLTVNGAPASEANLSALAQSRETIQYVFCTPGAPETLRIEADGMPLGIEIARTNEAIRERASRGDADGGDLCMLWRRGEGALLREVTRDAYTKPGPFMALVSAILPFLSSHPSEEQRMYLGAGLCEAGEDEAGMQIIHTYLEEHSQNWTAHTTAVALYYLAEDLNRRGESEQALSEYLESYQRCSSERAADTIRRLGGEVPVKEELLRGEQFPVMYAYPTVENGAENGADTCSLASALAELADGQFLLVTMLANYRCNGPYNDLMEAYIGLVEHFGAIVPSMHVIVGEDGNPHWTEQEVIAREKKLPFSVLLDADCTLLDDVPITGSPYCMLLNRAGTVCWSGRVQTGKDIWELLGSTSGKPSRVCAGPSSDEEDVMD